MAEVTILAVHKLLRKQKFAQFLIEEMLNRSRKAGLNVSYFSTFRSVPTNFSSVHLHNRYLNTDKLVDCEYSQLPKSTTRE